MQGVLVAKRTAQVTDWQRTCARVGNPSECEVCFNAQSDVIAARVVGIRQEGIESLRMVPSKRDEGREREQLPRRHGKVQGARAVNCRAGARAVSCRASAAQLKKKKGEQKQASLSGEQDSQAGVEDPLAWAQDTTS